MAFASVHIPDFILQAILRVRPEFRNDGARKQPLAVVDGKPLQQTVIAADSAALRSGIQMGMTKSQAEKFSSVVVAPRAPAQEAAAHAALLDLGWFFSPRVEDTAPDTILLDLGGLAALFGSEEKIAQGLARGASELGLTARIAIASNTETAFHASRGYAGITVIPCGEEGARMSGLPVRILAPSQEILEILESWGVRTCGDLAALPVLQLSERLGQAGVRLREWARGEGSRSLVLAEPQSGFAEEMELEDAVAELEPLSFVLGRLLDQLCARLAARSLSAAAIYLHFELEVPLRAENSSIYERTLALPVPMRNSKLLLNLVRLQLQAHPPPSGIVKVILRAEAARPRATQEDLFVPCYPEPEKLELTIARLSNLVGKGNIGAPELLDTHRPDAFRVGAPAFMRGEDGVSAPREKASRRRISAGVDKSGAKAPVERAHASVGLKYNSLLLKQGALAEAKILAADAPQEDDVADFAPAPKAVLRIFRPPLSMKVESAAAEDAWPRRVFFHGRCGEVVRASGPWRSSGGWWAGAWQWDEWDVEVHFHFASAGHQGITRGIYRIYFDRLAQGWFVYGVYD